MKRLVLILSLICLTIPGWAEQVSRDQALRKAQQFLVQKGLPSSVKAAETELSRRRAQGIPQPDYYYVFNNDQNLGFVIISGDDRAETVLGYATSGRFDVDNIPSNMAAWLQGYADQIKYIQEHPALSAQEQTVRRSYPAISKLMTCQWDQDDPFNAECPTVGTKKCVTGCVTTAVSQILYYHAKTSGYTPSSTAIPGYTTESRGDKMPDLPAASFDWVNMIDVYNSSATAEQKAAVAKLFQYVGTGLKAAYDLSENGGTSVWDNMPEIVFKDYFGYSNGIQLVHRADAIPESEWDNLICNELANGRPVLYSGQGSAGGHTFVIDGYDGAGKYAINWGWGGYQDNYFALSALNPELGGAGAGGGGFNYKQSALVGISPTDVTPYQISETVVLTTDYIELPAGDNIYTIPAGHSQFGPVTIYARYKSELSSAYNIEYNYKILKNGEFLEYLFKTSPGFSSFGPGYYFPYNTSASRLDEMSFYLPGWDSYSSTLGLSFKEPGTYKMIPVSREAGTSEWIENVNSEKYFITGVVSSDMKLKMYVGEPGGSDPKPEVTQADLDNLTKQYAAQKMAIETKLAAIADNEMRLSAVAQTLTKKTNALSTIDAKIASLEEKLKSEYLTAEQKQSYTNQLNEIKAQSAALLTQINSANSELESLQSKGNSLKSTLNGLLTSSNTQAAAVASITTKADLETSQAKLAEITTQLSACDVSSEASKITALESGATTIGMSDTSGMSTNLTTLETTIDAAIEAGKNAKDEEAKAKLEEGKKALAEACDKIAAELLGKQEAVAANEKTCLAIETAIKEAQDAIEPVEKKIAAIKESLKSEMLTAEQKADFSSRLETLEKAKSAYADNVKSLSDALALAKKDNENLKSALDEISALIKDLHSGINAITTTDALDKAKEDAEKVEAQLSAVSGAEVEKQLLSLQDNLGKLSLDDTTKDLAALEDEVDKAIAGGQEEYEKQQAEKLAKAQEECQKAIDDLDEAIKTYNDYNDKLKDAHGKLKADMQEIEEAIALIKKQYAEIEKTLQELIEKQSSTRADASETIAALQEKLKKLAENIATLENLYAQISEQVDKLNEQLQQFETVIETATQARSQLQEGLSTAATATEVESLTSSVTKATNKLNSDGVSAYNLYVKNYNIVYDNLSMLIDDINMVYQQATSLQSEVEEVVTAINQLIIDESEVVARYDMKGNPVDSTYKGVQIIRLKNGKTIKLNVK